MERGTRRPVTPLEDHAMALFPQQPGSVVDRQLPRLRQRLDALLREMTRAYIRLHVEQRSFEA